MTTSTTGKRNPIRIAVAVAALLNIILGCVWWFLGDTEKKLDSSVMKRFFAIHSARPEMRKLIPSSSRKPLDSSALFYSYSQAARTVQDQYDGMVADRRMIQAIARLARDTEDFPVQSGDEIVACSYHLTGDSRTSFWGFPSRENGPVSMMVYVPPEVQKLTCTFSTEWKNTTGVISEDSGVFEFAATPGAVNDFSCHFEGSTLHLSMNSKSQSYDLISSGVMSRSSGVFYRRCFPNQRLGPATGRRSGAWEETRMKPNEIFNQTYSLTRKGRQGTVNVVCQLESDAPQSYCVMNVAANNQSFIDRVLVDRENAMCLAFEMETLRRKITDVFRNPDNSGLLYSRGNFSLFPRRSH